MKYSLLLIIASLPLLAACHHDTRPAWQKAEVAPHLKIPAGIDTPGRSAEMSVPAATGQVEGEVHDDTAPPSSVTLTSDQDTSAAWQDLTAKIEKLGVGTIISRDNQQHHLGLVIKGSDLPGPQGGFFSRMFASKPDPSRDYYAMVGVASENGQTVVNVDGDSRAALHLGQLLQGPTLHLAGSKGGDVSRLEQRNRVPTQTGAPDASGRN